MSSPMSVLCVIPARGGSKRIPYKNIKPFCGKPIIAYSIECARAAGIFDRIIVSTDDKSIIRVALQYGAEVPFVRPARLADDYATTDDVFLHAINEIEKTTEPVAFACCLYATAPFVRPADLRAGLALLKERSACSAFPIAPFSYPIFRALKINQEGRIEMYWPEYQSTRSQDLPKLYHDTGQFYWVDAQKYKHKGRILSDDSVPLILKTWRVIDIDTVEDWEHAERLWRAYGSESEVV